jgi:hypothetical protein
MRHIYIILIVGVIMVICVTGALLIGLHYHHGGSGGGPKPPGPKPPGPKPPKPKPPKPKPPKPKPPKPKPPKPKPPKPKPPKPKPHSVTFQIENIPTSRIKQGSLIGWSAGNTVTGLPKYGQLKGNPSFKLSGGNLKISAINFITRKQCFPNDAGDNTPCFSIWLSTNQNLKSICQDLGDCSINLEIKGIPHILNMRGAKLIRGQNVLFYWRNPDNVGTKGRQGMWPMPKAGDNVKISIISSS